MQQLGMNMSIRSQHFTTTEIRIATIKIGDTPTSLREYQAAGCHIPRTKKSLYTPLGTACSYIAKFHRSRAQQAFSTYRTIHLPYQAEYYRTKMLAIVRETKQYLCLIHRSYIRHTYRFIVQVSPSSLVCPITLIAAYFIHYTKQYLGTIAQSYTYTIGGHIVYKVSRTIQRVYHPTILFPRILTDSLLFGNKTGFWE